MTAPARFVFVLAGIAVFALLLSRAASQEAAAHATSPYRTIAAVFGSTAPAAYRVARCETGGTFNPRALGRAGERGWFQVHPIHFGRTVRSRVGSVYVSSSRLFDPRFNSRVAYVISSGGTSWRAWSCKP